MTTYRYTGPSCIATRKGICPVCGKKGSRQTTIQHTVNPFNRNPDGSVRTYQEVSERVRAEADQWSTQPFMHAKCERETKAEPKTGEQGYCACICPPGLPGTDLACLAHWGLS